MTGKEFSRALDELTHYLVGYEDFITQFKLALLTRNHILLHGETGSGKSYACRVALGAIKGAEVFRTQVSAFTVPDHLIGAQIPEAYLQRGEQIYNLRHGLADCHLALLDEFTDVSEALAKSLNTLLHERLFETKDMRVKIPLHTVLMTANQIPLSKAWEPVLARIVFRFNATNIQGYFDRYRMQRIFERTRGVPPELGLVDFEEVIALHKRVKEMPVPDGVHYLLSYIVEEYAKAMEDQAHIHLCGRDNTALVDIVRAAAVLEDQEVSYSHLPAIKYALCERGNTEECRRQQAVLDHILEQALPQAKHLREETRLYDSLGSLAHQLADAYDHQSPDHQRVSLPFELFKTVKFVWLSELEGYLADVTGRVVFQPAKALASELKRQVGLLVSRRKNLHSH